MMKMDDETPPRERKRLRLEAPRHGEHRSGGRARHVPELLPFVSPERAPRDRAFSPDMRHHHPSMIRTPLQVRASGKRSAIPSPVLDHMAATRKKVRSSIAAHKSSAMQQLERQYLALHEKILTEIGDAEQQLEVLQKANNSINEKTDRKLKAMAELAASEITKIERAHATATTSTAQLYAKEKQKILQRFDAELDALAK